MKKLLVTVLDLLDCNLVVVRSDRDITTVDNLEAGEERVDSEGYVIAAVKGQTTGASANACRSEPGAGPVRSASILPKRSVMKSS